MHISVAWYATMSSMTTSSFLILILSVFLLSACSSTQQPATPPLTASPEAAAPTNPKKAPSDAVQVAFTSEADAQALVARGPVVYFFKANWCPTCQALQKELDTGINTLPNGTTIVTVDYDNSKALQTKYAVTYQHTLVQIDATGAEITKWQGGGVVQIAEKIIQ